MQVGAGTTGIQDKRDGVVKWFTLRQLNIFDDRIPKIVFRYYGQRLRNRFPIQTNAISMEDCEVDCKIWIALDAAIPVFPGASAQPLLIVLAPDFTIVKITEQRVLEREQILLNQKTDVERTRHL